MVCLKSCGVGLVFLFAMMYLCAISPMFLEETKYDVNEQLKDTLTIEQKNKLQRIKRERMDIYLKGYGIGLVISGLVLLYRFNNPKSKKLLNTNVMFCTTLSITFLVNYFFYILAPKTEWMVTSLHSEEQKEAWLKVYRHMQYNYHLGFVFGILAVGFISRGACKC